MNFADPKNIVESGPSVFLKDSSFVAILFNASLEDIMNGVQTYRNPKLVHIFDKLEMIENF